MRRMEKEEEKERGDCRMWRDRKKNLRKQK